MQSHTIPIDVKDTVAHIRLDYNKNELVIYKAKLHGNKRGFHKKIL